MDLLLHFCTTNTMLERNSDDEQFLEKKTVIILIVAK